MTNQPKVEPYDWIKIGNEFGPWAVACHVYDDPTREGIEVVYLNEKGQAISEDVIWDGKTWSFKHSGAVGGYADRSSRLIGFVQTLKSGRKP